MLKRSKIKTVPLFAEAAMQMLRFLPAFRKRAQNVKAK
jgi:hypothetical protein